MSSVIIREAQQSDAGDVWAILEPIIRAGETFALPREMSEQDALSFWLSPEKHSFVAEIDGEIVGTYYLRANQLGGGSHVCNCGYMTAEKARGRGVARQMCLHSLGRAQELGFRAMQFNCVVSTNEGAIRLWQRLGFDIAGTLPGAFHHPRLGDIDAYVMFQKL